MLRPNNENNNQDAFQNLARAEDDGFPIGEIFGKDILAMFNNLGEEDKMPIQKLRKYLDENKIKYTVISHSTAYTAQETAQRAHVAGKELAKTIIVKIEKQTAMVVLPASYKIDFGFLREIMGSENVRLASEQGFKDMFPDCEIGAMSPFGNLYSIDVYVAKRLTEDEEIAFNAGNHRELIKMSYKDFDRLVHPTVLDLTYEPAKL